MNTLAQRIKDAAKETGSVVCVGLDPVVEKLPKTAPTIVKFNAAIIEATTDVVAAYKLNMAFYLAEGIPGLKAMEETIACVRRNAPHALLIADAKLGDVEHAADAYATAYFETWDFDVVTLSPYIGSDAIKPFLKYLHKGVFVCALHSNSTLEKIEYVSVLRNNSTHDYLYEVVAENTGLLAKENKGRLGLTVTNSYNVVYLRSVFPHMPFLIHGDDNKTFTHAIAVSWNRHNNAIALVTFSDKVIYASSGAEFGYAARKACIDLNTILKPPIMKG